MIRTIICFLPLFLLGPSVNALNCTLKNEFLNPCPGPCIPGKFLTCLNYLNNYYAECDPNYPAPKQCVPACECKEGFIRSILGECVLPENCCDDEPNSELMECAEACPKTCGNWETWRTNECLKPCRTRKCACKEGYVESFGGTQRCILPKECKKGKCGKNEVLDSCVPCPPNTKCPKICRQECVCKENFRRSKTTGACVPVKNNCGKNERFGIGNCDATCDDPNLICQLRNRLGCFCRKGYVRNAKKQCVEVSKCADKCNPELNEVFGRGGKDGTCNNPDLKNANVEAIYGCFCPEGYLRSHLNVCELPDGCKKCGPNEEYRQSPYNTRCKDAFEPSKDPTLFDCYCKAGYARYDNKCILIEECINDCKSGEIFKLGNCDGTCKNPSTENCFAPERFDCFCRNGLVRDSNGVCVKPENCVKPKPPKCRRDEVLNVCPAYCTIEKSCATEFEGGGISCIPEHEDYVCQPRCECKKGLLRLNGKCVRPEKCCKDPNEMPVPCPQPCEPTCFTMPDSECQKDRCYGNTCVCKKGYVRKSETDNTCILREECGDPDECH